MRWWQDERSALAVEIVSRIVLARPPGPIDRFLGGRDGRRERDDGTDVEVDVWRPVHPASDPFLERVVHRGMTQGAGDAESDQRVLPTNRTDRALESNDG